MKKGISKWLKKTFKKRTEIEKSRNMNGSRFDCVSLWPVTGAEFLMSLKFVEKNESWGS